MAEVGQRLGSGAYRLSALRNSQSRSVCTGGSPGSLLVNCTFSDRRLKEDSTRDQREVHSGSRAQQRKSQKLSRVRTCESQREHGILRCATSLYSSRFIRESLQTPIEALYLPARLQPLLQEKLLCGRMTSWTRGGVFIHPDTFRSPQQLRAFCTVLLTLAEQGSEKLRRLHPGTLQALSTRSYSWRSGSSSKDVPPLYRSRTYYYDILRVSPTATQSQIKTAYYKQSFIFHPDKNQGNKEEAAKCFSEISEAYTVLGNISLRKKYDRGILSRSDVQSAGRPSSKESTGRSTGSSQQQYQQHRARRFSQHGGKTMFDFDAFYKAHYGEQLQRERDLRARKEHMQQLQKEAFRKWNQGKMIEMSVLMLLTMVGLICFTLSKP